MHVGREIVEEAVALEDVGGLGGDGAVIGREFEIEKVERDPQFSGAGSYVKYVISGHAGKRVNFLSLKPDECEILIDKGAKFRITSGPDQKFAFDASRRSGAVEIRIEQM